MVDTNLRRHFIADRDMTEQMYNDQVSCKLSDAIKRRAELVTGLNNSKDALKRLKNPAFVDQIYLSMPSFRLPVSVTFMRDELERQIGEAEAELEELDGKIQTVEALFFGEDLEDE